MPMMDLRKEYRDRERQRRRERRDKEYDDSFARWHDRYLKAMEGRQNIELQKVSDQGAMARSMLSDATDRARLNMQFGPNGYYTNQTAIAREQLQNEGYNYVPTTDANGNETVNVYRRGKLMNPAETFEDSDMEKLLAPGSSQVAAASPGMGNAGSGMVRRADGTVINLNPAGQITTSNPVMDRIRQQMVGIQTASSHQPAAPSVTNPVTPAKKNTQPAYGVPATGEVFKSMGRNLLNAGKKYMDYSNPYRNF